MRWQQVLVKARAAPDPVQNSTLNRSVCTAEVCSKDCCQSKEQRNQRKMEMQMQMHMHDNLGV